MNTSSLGYDVIPSNKVMEISVLAIIRIMNCAQLNILREWNTPTAAMGSKGYFVSTILAVNKYQNLVKLYHHKIITCKVSMDL